MHWSQVRQPGVLIEPWILCDRWALLTKTNLDYWGVHYFKTEDCIALFAAMGVVQTHQDDGDRIACIVQSCIESHEMAYFSA